VQKHQTLVQLPTPSFERLDKRSKHGATMQSKEHWERVYSTKPTDGVSWYQPHAELSLKLIHETGLPLTASIIDVGGGASTLVDDLFHEGYRSLTVLDLSSAALLTAQARLGEQAKTVHWLEANVTEVELPSQTYDLWHDRAVFHFFTSAEERQVYVAKVLEAVKSDGFVIVATFAEDGPRQCSGLPVMRYSETQLHTEFGKRFRLLRHEHEEHHTPFGTVQKFVYCLFQKLVS
jgi:2-polyprenyl-3-methyl-5-hydroxy-6-metoxy-1,4-benzoquinol methylase